MDLSVISGEHYRSSMPSSHAVKLTNQLSIKWIKLFSSEKRLFKTISVSSVLKMCAQVSDWTEANSFSKLTNQKPYLEHGVQEYIKLREINNNTLH